MSFTDAMKVAGVPMLKLLVNGHEGVFVVDTGANCCQIDEEFAKEIGAEEIPSSTKSTISLGGRTPVSHSYYVTFTLGEWELSEVPCTGNNFGTAKEYLRRKGVRMDGIIGVPVMSALHAVIDMNECTLTFNLLDVDETEES